MSETLALTVPDGAQFSIADPRPKTLEIHGHRGMLVRIDLDTGAMTFGEHYSPDSAASAFWEAVGRGRPMSGREYGNV